MTGAGKPTNLSELFKFYGEYVKPLYAAIQVDNTLPIETIFEITAAFDHISRHWTRSEPEEVVVEQAFSHLKRSCLDIFKLKLRTAKNQYDALCLVDLSEIDNGEFEYKLHQLFADIRREATRARQMEGQDDSRSEVPSFEIWESVYAKCSRLESEFFLNPQIKWTRKNKFSSFIYRYLLGFSLGLLSALLAAIIIATLSK